MAKAIAIAIGLASGALALASGIALERVASLEARELETASPWATLRERASGSSARLLEATLLRGDEVTFELCSRDAMDAAQWSGAARLGVVRVDVAEEMFALPIDARMLERAARTEDASCVTFARVDALAIDSEEIPAAVEVTWDAAPEAILDVPLRARILARHGLGHRDLGIVLAALIAAISLVFALASRQPRITRDAGRDADRSRGALRAVLGLGLVLGAGMALGAFAPGGPTWGLVGGLALAGVEVAAAFALVRAHGWGARTAALGLERPRRGATAVAAFALAPFAGIALFSIARIALRLVPSTGEAPVEVFVSWPSGMLSFAALAVIAPIAEEVFFRGLVYGALRGEGGVGADRALRITIAIGGSWLLFAFAHLPQSWGNWGGMTSVLIAGLGFTILRATTRSTLVPCVAHLVYNGLLATSALAAGAA